ncbi:MAG: alpha/beta hydrolase [Candidatus Binataceae bacterium]
MCVQAGSVEAARIVEATIKTDLVPTPVEYAVLLPDGYEAGTGKLPLVLFLHGGNGDRSFLKQMQPVIEKAWASGAFPPAVFATPSAARSFYMDYRDGSEKWESFIVGQFLGELRKNYRVTSEAKDTFLFGISMGGMGALRMALKYPERFGGVAAMEPGIDPALRWKDVPARNRFWRSDDLMQRIYGKPMDEAYWEANNPASIAIANREKIRAAKLPIYIECGDHDMFNLHEATEFMHRVLWDHQIEHEYHLVYGADHLGASLGPRSLEGLAFLSRTLNPWQNDRRTRATRVWIGLMKRRAGVNE